MKTYYDDLSALDKEFNLGTTDFMKIILTLPDVMTAETSELNPDEWKAAEVAFRGAGDAFNTYRLTEGSALEKDMVERIDAIRKGVLELEKFEPTRIEAIKKRLQSSLEEFIQASNIDRNRFEQELIFYIEKLDVSEEKVRLRSHCDYFIKTLQTDSSAGKKLAFITQEIGREINTIGSKANDAEMQKVVVNMKDELEKIKEQSMNIL